MSVCREKERTFTKERTGAGKRYIHHYENGKAKYRYLYGKTYTEAKLRRQEEMTKIENVQISTLKRFAVFDEICRQWLVGRKQSVKESTYTRYIRIVDHYLLPELGGIELLTIKSENVNHLLQALGCSLSDKTVSDIICVLKSIWKYGRDNGYPCCELDLTKCKTKRAHEITLSSTSSTAAVRKCGARG